MSTATILRADARALPLPDASVDAIVCDPPYELGFMGRSWDSTGVAYDVDMWRGCLRVLKPGGYLLAFGGSRTWHRLTCAIEDAGFEIRDSMAWLYGSGFPKSLDVSKAIDAAAGAEREVVGSKLGRPGYSLAPSTGGNLYEGSFGGTGDPAAECAVTAPATDHARRWQGWGTALKPGFEPIVVARKPLIGTVAANMLQFGTGALNIDATRVPTSRGAAGSSPGSSTVCTCPSRAGGQTNRNTNTPHPVSSDASLEGHSDPLASALAGAIGYPPPQDSLDGCRPSLRSGGEHAQSAVGDAQASARRLPDADASPALDASPGYSPASLSMPCLHCTAGSVEKLVRPAVRRENNTVLGKGLGVGTQEEPAGRWPTNVVLSHSPLVDDGGEIIGDACADGCVPGCPVAELDAQSGTLTSGSRRAGTHGLMGYMGAGPAEMPAVTGDSGGASRFFPTFRYEAKAPDHERPRVDGVAHPTVKPLELIRWLCRLVTQPGGRVLDMFGGSGTTGEAALMEGFDVVVSERDADYLPLIQYRADRARRRLQPGVARLAKTKPVAQTDGQADLFADLQAETLTEATR